MTPRGQTTTHVARLVVLLQLDTTNAVLLLTMIMISLTADQVVVLVLVQRRAADRRLCPYVAVSKVIA